MVICLYANGLESLAGAELLKIPRGKRGPKIVLGNDYPKLYQEALDRLNISRKLGEAYRLHLLGWTNEEIGIALGVNESTIRANRKNFNTKLYTDEYQSGMT